MDTFSASILCVKSNVVTFHGQEHLDGLLKCEL